LSVSQSILHGFTWSLVRSSGIIQMQLVIESLPQYYVILLTKICGLNILTLSSNYDGLNGKLEPSRFKLGSNHQGLNWVRTIRV
jgi:hypothetical protein